MVQARRTFVQHLTSFDRLKSTIINEIAVEVFLFTAWAAAVALITNFKTSLAISPQMLTVLGTVLGLVVSFRTTSAYDRYWEGRKLWSTVILASRNLGHLIWIHVPADRSDKATPENPLPPDAKLKAILEKKSMINLVEAFSISVKHYLRGESGIFYTDLYPLVSFLPRHAPSSDEFQKEEDTLPLWHASTSTLHAPNGRKRANSLPGPPQGLDARMHGHEGDLDVEKTALDRERERDREMGIKLPPNVRLLPARNPPKESLYDYVPVLLIFKPVISGIRRIIRGQHKDNDTNRNWMGKKIKPTLSVESNVPLEICLFLSSYLASLLKQGLLQPAIATAFVNNLGSLQESVTSLERVRTTPIPFAYQMHLRMTIWLYLLFLPFQIVSALHWITIPATAFAAFLYLGFLEIGSEIEDPFQYDANDLDLDHFCRIVSRELAEVTAHPTVEPADYIFSQWNQPLAPSDRRSAHDIVQQTDHGYHDEETGVNSVRRTLLAAWRERNDHEGESKKKQ